MNEEQYKVEFQVGSPPNDMKMLAFLCGELTNSAYYFTTFADVTKDDIKKSFSIDGSISWKPFTFERSVFIEFWRAVRDFVPDFGKCTSSTRNNKGLFSKFVIH